MAIWIVYGLPATLQAEQTLSDDAVDQLTQNVQNELNARQNTAQSTDELFPGATVAIALPDGRVMGFATGFADLEKTIPMPVEARMPAGSIGKTFVAAVVLGMVADGKLDLDDSVARWLGDEPWFERLPNGGTMTLRHLLNHSSGLIDHVFDEASGFANDFRAQFDPDHATDALEPREFVQYALDQEPLFRAGEGFHYSETGYILAGMVIEKAGGSSYYDELDRRLLQPLGLMQTSGMNRRAFTGLVPGYAPKARALFGSPYKVADAGVFAFDPSLEWTGGGLVTNSQDLVRWAKALFEGRAISPRYLDEMVNSIAQPEQGRDAAGRTFGYGLGVNVVGTSYGTVYRHGGFFPGYNSMLVYFPDRGIAVAMQINADATKIEEHIDAMLRIIMGFFSEAQ